MQKHFHFTLFKGFVLHGGFVLGQLWNKANPLVKIIFNPEKQTNREVHTRQLRKVSFSSTGGWGGHVKTTQQLNIVQKGVSKMVIVSVKIQITIIMVIVISGGAYWQWGSSRRDWLHCRSTSSWYKVSLRRNDRWWSLMVKLVILNQDSWLYLWFSTQVPCRVFFIKPEREKYREGSSFAKMMTNNDDDSDDNNYDNSDDNNHDNIDIKWWQ